MYNLQTTQTTQTRINEATSTIAKAKEVKKAMNDIIETSTHQLMLDINILFNETKSLESNKDFNNKSIALLVLSDTTINHSSDTRLLLEMLTNGLTIHQSLKFSTLKFGYKHYKAGNISKNKFNNETKLLESISEIKKQIKISNAQNLLSGEVEVIEVELLENK